MSVSIKRKGRIFSFHELHPHNDSLLLTKKYVGGSKGREGSKKETGSSVRSCLQPHPGAQKLRVCITQMQHTIKNFKNKNRIMVVIVCMKYVIF